MNHLLSFHSTSDHVLLLIFCFCSYFRTVFLSVQIFEVFHFTYIDPANSSPATDNKTSVYTTQLLLPQCRDFSFQMNSEQCRIKQDNDFHINHISNILSTFQMLLYRNLPYSQHRFLPLLFPKCQGTPHPTPEHTAILTDTRFPSLHPLHIYINYLLINLEDYLYAQIISIPKVIFVSFNIKYL